MELRNNPEMFHPCVHKRGSGWWGVGGGGLVFTIH